MLIAELKKLQLKAELVSVERDCHDEELTGTIQSITEQITCMHLYTNDGEYDGFTVFETEQIKEVIWGNREHLAIAAGINKSNKHKTWKFGNKKFVTVLSELSQADCVLCLHQYHDEGNFDIAEIIEISNEWVNTHCYGTRKSLSRINKIIRTEGISRVVINSPYQNQIISLQETHL